MMNATTTTATATGPLKGKPKDDPTQSTLPSHWWNYYALVEQRRSPVVWTSLAILFAHESEPAIVGRAFPSSRQFRIQSPTVIANTPGSYDPPTILCVSPDENWLFAYFPGRQIPGVGCFWRAQHADGWDIIESISFARGRGVVSAKWLGHVREWVADSGRNALRLPPLGPAVLVSLPTLVLITQNLQVQLCSIRSGPQQPKIATISCSLEKHDEPRDANNVPSNLEFPSGFESRYCTHATIGVGYNESSILVATRSRPNPLPLESSYVSLGLDEVPELSPHFHDVHLAESVDWESWAQEPNIELCEVRLGFDGVRTLPFANPLSPLRCDAHPLSSIAFCPGDPPQSTVAESSSVPLTLKMYLCLSLLDLGKYDDRASGTENRLGPGADSTIPKSELIVFGLYKRVHPHANISEWSSTKLTSKTFSETLTFILPHHRSPRANTVVAGSLSVQGPASYSRRNVSTKPPSGNMTVLKLPSLEVHPEWGSEPLFLGWSESSYGYPPVSVALSPNTALLCAISQSTTTTSKLTIHTIPKKYPNDNPAVGHPHVPDFVSALLSAIRSKRTISDVAHQLSLSSVSVQEVESVLCEVLEALESHDFGLRDVWFHDFLGILLEVYRVKGCQRKLTEIISQLAGRQYKISAPSSPAIVLLKIVWTVTALGSNSWPLIVLSTWIVDFLEELMRECVLLGDSREELGDEVTEKQTIPSTHPILLSLLYPDALAKLRVTVGHVKQLYEQLKGVDPNGENGTIAKNTLLDTVESSGINLQALELLLAQISEKNDESNAVDVRRSIAACNPVPKVYPLLWAIAQAVSKSDAIEKSRLFIKPQEFVSEIGKMRKSSEYVGEGQDIVLKGILARRRPTRVCVRCGGKSQQHELGLRGDGPIPGTSISQWHVWRRRWWARCICGGRWVRIDVD